MELPAQARFHAETINGKQYDVATLKQVVLFPQKSGELEVFFNRTGLSLVPVKKNFQLSRFSAPPRQGAHDGIDYG